MLVTKAQLLEGEWVLRLGIGGGVATASLAIAKALGARALVTSSSDAKLERARELGADAAVNHASGDVAEAVKRGDRRSRASTSSLEHVGEATWRTSLGGRRDRAAAWSFCGATSGPNPPAQLHRVWWKQLTIYGSTMGTREDFAGAFELVKSLAVRGRSSIRSSRSPKREPPTSAWSAATSSARSCSGSATSEGLIPRSVPEGFSGRKRFRDRPGRGSVSLKRFSAERFRDSPLSGTVPSRSRE